MLKIDVAAIASNSIAAAGIGAVCAVLCYLALRPDKKSERTASYYGRLWMALGVAGASQFAGAKLANALIWGKSAPYVMEALILLVSYSLILGVLGFGCGWLYGKWKQPRWTYRDNYGREPALSARPAAGATDPTPPAATTPPDSAASARAEEPVRAAATVISQTAKPADDARGERPELSQAGPSQASGPPDRPATHGDHSTDPAEALKPSDPRTESPNAMLAGPSDNAGPTDRQPQTAPSTNSVEPVKPAESRAGRSDVIRLEPFAQSGPPGRPPHSEPTTNPVQAIKSAEPSAKLPDGIHAGPSEISGPTSRPPPSEPFAKDPGTTQRTEESESHVDEVYEKGVRALLQLGYGRSDIDWADVHAFMAAVYPFLEWHTAAKLGRDPDGKTHGRIAVGLYLAALRHVENAKGRKEPP